jgi:cytochrome c-type biogenesis protein CcmF
VPLGNLSLILALIAAAASALLFVAGRNGNVRLLGAGRRFYYVFFALTALASAYLLYLLLTHQFNVEYVYGYSSSDLPLFYLISSFWAGQEGTFLLWLFLGASLGLFVIRRTGQLEGYTMAFYLLIEIFLLALLLKKSPFSLTPFSPQDGRGLNPLLQDFWMVIHPPIIFVGYAALAVPFALGLSALARNDPRSWLKPAFPWAVFSCLSLGAGIFIGGYWSYKVLGWGGYWGWDPVENASLVPWLLSIALVHGLLMERTKGSMRRSNFLLAIFCFLLVLYATFLTRSGVLGDFSVHSFADLGINAYLVVFMLLFLVLSFGLFFCRVSRIKHVEAAASVLSRDFTLLLAVIFLAVSAALVLLGTSSPIITRLLGTASNVSTRYYVNTQLPLAMVLAAILGLAPLLKFGSTSWISLRQALVPSLSASLLLTAMTFALGVGNALYLVFLFFSFFAFSSNLWILIKRSKTGLRFSGGYLAHVGLGLMFVGMVASSGYSRSVKLNLHLNQPARAFGYEFSYLGAQEDASRQENFLEIRVQKGKSSFLAHPRFYYSDYTQGIMRSPSIRVKLLEDIYLAPVERLDSQQIGGGRLVMAKGDTATVDDYSLKFLGFDMSTHQMESRIRVGAFVEIRYDQQVDTLTPSISMDQSTLEQFQDTVFFPDGENRLVLESIDADQGTVELRVLTSGEEPQGELLILEVSKKPLINVLWLGTVLVMLGMSIATYRRAKESKSDRL